MLKRFRFGSQDSITNPNPNIIRLAKITNPNPNIRDSEKKIRIRIRIRIFVTTLFKNSTWPLKSKSDVNMDKFWVCVLYNAIWFIWKAIQYINALTCSLVSCYVIYNALSSSINIRILLWGEMPILCVCKRSMILINFALSPVLQ